MRDAHRLSRDSSTELAKPKDIELEHISKVLKPVSTRFNADHMTESSRSRYFLNFQSYGLISCDQPLMKLSQSAFQTPPLSCRCRCTIIHSVQQTKSPSSPFYRRSKRLTTVMEGLKDLQCANSTSLFATRPPSRALTVEPPFATRRTNRYKGPFVRTVMWSTTC